MKKELLNRKIENTKNSEGCLQYTQETLLISYFVYGGTMEKGHFKRGNIDYPKFGDKLLATTFPRTDKFKESATKNGYTHYQVQKCGYLNNMGTSGWLYLNETTQGEI